MTWKWSLLCDRNGIPLGWATDGANRHDTRLLEMTLTEVKERFRSRLAEEGGVRRLLDALRKQTYVSVRPAAIGRDSSDGMTLQ